MFKFVLVFLFPVLVLASDYSDGLEAMRARKYERAIDRFTKALDKDVMKGVVTEAKAKEALNKAQVAYLGELNIKIVEQDKEKKYKEAISLVNKGLKVVPDSAKFLKAKTDYEDKIKDLEAKVKEGEILINNKEWEAAYSYFQKILPYEDTVSAISSNYKKAKNEIIDGYSNQAELDEKNYDFIAAKKEYEKALSYDAKDKSLNKKIDALKQRISAQEIYSNAKNISEQGQKDKAYEMLKIANEKDEDNKEIVVLMNILKDDIARKWMDEAIALESAGKYKDAYLTITKAEELKSEAKDVRAVIESAKKSIILNYAKSLSDKAEKIKGNDENAYVYYVASYSLNSEDKAVENRIKELETNIKEKLCYNLSINTIVSPKTTMDSDTVASVDNLVKQELASFFKDKCINVSEPKDADGQLTSTVLTYKSETKGNVLTLKLDIESGVVDFVTKKSLSKTRKFEFFAGDADKNNDIKVAKEVTDKVVREIVSNIKDSNLRYYGDRYYLLFNSAKDPQTKKQNAVRTFIVKRYLSDDDLFSNNAVEYILKTSGVDIKRKKVHISDKVEL